MREYYGSDLAGTAESRRVRPQFDSPDAVRRGVEETGIDGSWQCLLTFHPAKEDNNMGNEWREAHAWLAGYSDALELGRPETKDNWSATSELVASYVGGYNQGAAMRVAVSA